MRCARARANATERHPTPTAPTPASGPVARGASSVGSLTGYHPPHTTSRVLHVAMATRDQVDMGVANGLASTLAAVHADVEAAHRSILLHNLGPLPIQQLVYRASLRLKQIACAGKWVLALCIERVIYPSVCQQLGWPPRPWKGKKGVASFLADLSTPKYRRAEIEGVVSNLQHYYIPDPQTATVSRIDDHRRTA